VDFAGAAEDREAILVLLSLASLTPRRLLELSGRHGRAGSCLAAVRRGEAGSEADRGFAGTIDPRAIAARLEECGARLVAVGEPEYPPELLELFDPPAGVFVRGSVLGRGQPRVAIVGARNCSPPGREVASQLGRALADAGLWVVSGGARGIDSAAHGGAMEAGGLTIAVLGCGIDVPYPKQNRVLLDEISRTGAIVSEYPPGTPPEPFRFPARNRIVAGLSRAVVVVEGAPGSGSMITADHALDLGREVFAVPGPVTSELAAVPLALIREGATLIRGPDDLLQDLGFDAPVPRGEAPGVVAEGRTENVVWEALSAPTTPDGLARATGLALPDVISALVGLELRGYVRQAGGRYERRLRGLGGS